MSQSRIQTFAGGKPQGALAVCQGFHLHGRCKPLHSVVASWRASFAPEPEDLTPMVFLPHGPESRSGS